MGSANSSEMLKRGVGPVENVWQATMFDVIKIHHKLHNAHLTNTNNVDRRSLSHLLPFRTDLSLQLCDLFVSVESGGDVNWKECLGGLTLCVFGEIHDKVDFILKMYNLGQLEISEGELQAVLQTVFNATQRISNAVHSNDSNGISVKMAFLNIDNMVAEILAKLFSMKKRSTITIEDLHLWASENSAMIQAAFRLQNSLLDMAANDREDNKNDGLSTNTNHSYIWSPCTHLSDAKVPCSRSKHAMCLSNGYMYLYGGRDISVPLKDFWKYDIVANTWELLDCNGDPPGTLEEHTMVAYKRHIYLFGGEFGFITEETPLWIYSIDCNSWEKFSIDSDVMVPLGRRAHTAVISHNAMHIFGGYIDLKGSSSELWSYDFESESWHLAYSSQLTDEGPGPRHSHTAVVHDNSMWILGGMTDLQPRDDMWKWSFTLRKWSRVRCRQGPTELYGHTAVKVFDGMIVFGGEHGGILKNEMWKFHFGNLSWQKISVQSLTPNPRTRHCCVIVTSLLLGNSSSHSDRSHSVPYMLESSCDNQTRVLPPRPMSSPPVINSEKQKRFRNKVSPMTDRPVFPLSCEDTKYSEDEQEIPQLQKYSGGIPREPFSTPNLYSLTGSQETICDNDQTPLLRRDKMKRSKTCNDPISLMGEDNYSFIKEKRKSKDSVEVLKIEDFDDQENVETERIVKKCMQCLGSIGSCDHSQYYSGNLNYKKYLVYEESDGVSSKSVYCSNNNICDEFCSSCGKQNQTKVPVDQSLLNVSTLTDELNDLKTVQNVCNTNQLNGDDGGKNNIKHTREPSLPGVVKSRSLDDTDSVHVSETCIFNDGDVLDSNQRTVNSYMHRKSVDYGELVVEDLEDCDFELDVTSTRSQDFSLLLPSNSQSDCGFYSATQKQDSQSQSLRESNSQLDYSFYSSSGTDLSELSIDPNRNSHRPVSRECHDNNQYSYLTDIEIPSTDTYQRSISVDTGKMNQSNPQEHASQPKVSLQSHASNKIDRQSLSVGGYRRVPQHLALPGTPRPSDDRLNPVPYDPFVTTPTAKSPVVKHSAVLYVFGGRETGTPNIGLAPISIWKCEIVTGRAVPQQISRLLHENKVMPV